MFRPMLKTALGASVRATLGVSLCVAACLPLCSGAAWAGDVEPSISGKVVGLYVQNARHLLVEISLAQRGAANRIKPGSVIADIRFAKPLGDGRSGTFAKVDDDCLAGLDTGDVVTVALVESPGGKRATAPLRRSDEVRAVEAKYHTAAAQSFGRSTALLPTDLSITVRKLTAALTD